MRTILFERFNINPNKYFQSVRSAAQLFPIYTDENGVDNLILTLRAKNMPLPGEIVPPGGNLKYENKFREAALIGALREGKEETNLEVTEVAKFGSFFVPLGIHVDCHVGKVADIEAVKRCEKEVQAIFLVTIETLTHLKPEWLYTEVEYNPKFHTKHLKNGFQGKAEILKIRPSQMKILDGKVEDQEQELVFRSYYPFKMLMNFIQKSPEPFMQSFELAGACNNIGKLPKFF